MAIVALIFGSILGSLLAIAGWLVLGIGVSGAIGIYIGTGLATALVPHLVCAARQISGTGGQAAARG